VLPALCPAAHRIRARIGEDAEGALSRLPGSTRWFAFQINLTESSRVPNGRAALVERLQRSGVVPLNGRIADISKRAVQAACVACGLPSTLAPADGLPDEQLIVKSNENYGGMMEAQLTASERDFLGLDDGRGRVIQDAHSYRIVARRELCPEIWTDRNVIVERFVTNPAFVFFRAYILGDRLTITAAVNWSLIKKMYRDLEKQDFYFERGRRLDRPVGSRWGDLSAVVDGLSADLGRFCAHAGLDFGAIDIVMNDAGLCFIVDVNTTPHWGPPPVTDVLKFTAEWFAD
jgi:hypothetical protein